MNLQVASLGVNTVFNATTSLLGVRLDPYQVFNFFVEIEGVLAGGFSECSGIEVETKLEEYREGGLNEYTHNFISSTQYSPLVFKHGLSPIDGLWDWHQEIVVLNQVKRRNGTIYLLNRRREPLIWWNFKDAFPYKWTGPDLRADAGEVAFERIELVHRGLSRPRGLTAATGLMGNGITGI